MKSGFIWETMIFLSFVFPVFIFGKFSKSPFTENEKFLQDRNDWWDESAKERFRAIIETQTDFIFSKFDVKPFVRIARMTKKKLKVSLELKARE